MRPPLKIIAAWLVLRKTNLLFWYSIASAATRTVHILFGRLPPANPTCVGMVKNSSAAVTRWAASVGACLLPNSRAGGVKTKKERFN